MDVNEVKKIIEQAQEAVSAADVDADLRTSAFEKAVELLAGTVAPGAAASVGTPAPVGEPGDSPGILGKIGRKLKVDQAVIEDVFAVKDGILAVMVPNDALDLSKRGGTQELSVLTAAGRQAAGIEEWTSLETIREVCEYFGRHDSANFSKAVLDQGDLMRFAGTSRKREVQLRQAGWEEASQLVTRIGGGG